MPPFPSPPVAAEPLGFEALPGWREDEVAEAWPPFLRSARALADGTAPLRAAQPAPEALRRLAGLALAEGERPAGGARAFLERHTRPWRVEGGFFTGYYEPEIRGALEPGPGAGVPVLGVPADLVVLPAGDGPGLLGAALRDPDGCLSPVPDRAAIEGGALAGQGLERAYAADPVDLFFVHVQGSGRLRLPDGSTRRLVYAGRNGRSYTPIGRIAADQSGTPRPDMTMERLRAWLAEDEDRARDTMRQNRSYIFFDVVADPDPTLGPTGGQGLPLARLRSLAVDRTVWPYGLPVFVDVEVPGPERLRRLMVAQDTGSAILGPARADIFFGSGAEAGARAGATRATGGFTVLWPREPA